MLLISCGKRGKFPSEALNNSTELQPTIGPFQPPQHFEGLRHFLPCSGFTSKRKALAPTLFAQMEQPGRSLHKQQAQCQGERRITKETTRCIGSSVSLAGLPGFAQNMTDFVAFNIFFHFEIFYSLAIFLMLRTGDSNHVPLFLTAKRHDAGA